MHFLQKDVHFPVAVLLFTSRAGSPPSQGKKAGTQRELGELFQGPSVEHSNRGEKPERAKVRAGRWPAKPKHLIHQIRGTSKECKVVKMTGQDRRATHEAQSDTSQDNGPRFHP